MTTLKGIAAEIVRDACELPPAEMHKDTLLISVGDLRAIVDSRLEALAGAEPVAWMDDFGNAFPLAANKGAGSWRDADKRTWKPLYAAPQSMTVSRDALMDAFSIYADPQTVRVMYSVEKLRALGIELRDEG